MGTKALIRLLIALAVVFAIAAIVHFAGNRRGVSQVTSTTTKKKVFEDFPLNDVAAITVKEKERSLTLKKGKKSWEIAERENYAAQTPVVNALLKSLWDLNITQAVTIGKSKMGRLSLLDPADKTAADGETASVVTFKDKAGKELAVLWMGKVYERSENRPNPYGGGMATSAAGRYVRRGDNYSVYLVADAFKTVVTDPTEWLDSEFIKIDKIKTIAIKSGEAKDDWTLIRKEEDGDFAFAKKNKGELELDPAKTGSMKTAFGSSNTRFEDVFVGKEAKSKKLDETSFAITTFDGFTYNIAVGEKSDLNELPMTVKVSGKFQEKRKAGEEESDDEKKKLDKEFTDNLKTLKDKLAKEKALEGHVYKVRSYLVDSITKKRSELLKEKEAAADGSPKGTTTVAPGVNIPLPSGHPTLPKKKTTPSPAKVSAPEKKAATPKPKKIEIVKPKENATLKPKVKELPKPAAPKAKPAPPKEAKAKN